MDSKYLKELEKWKQLVQMKTTLETSEEDEKSNELKDSNGVPVHALPNRPMPRDLRLIR